MHKGSFATKVKEQVALLIRERITLVYDPPTEDQLRSNEALVTLLGGYEVEDDVSAGATEEQRHAFRSSAAQSRAWIIKHCPGPWSDRTRVYYYVAPSDTCQNAA